jgi:hypothetical protein
MYWKLSRNPRKNSALRALGVCFSAMFVQCTGTISTPSGASSPSGPGSDVGEEVLGEPEVLGTSSTGELACTAPSVGATPLSRQTRAQYSRSVTSLLGVTNFQTGALPDDEKVGPFDGNVIAPIGDLAVEQYAVAAETVAKSAMGKLETLVACDRRARGDKACADEFIRTFGKKVYRRPLSSDEQSAYAALYDAYAGQGYPDALRVLVQTMLQSPTFLYHVELAPPMPPSDGSKLVALDAFELASRLSYFLVGTTPDDALLAAAGDGSLLKDATLRAQATRLLADPLADDTLERFHLQWLALDDLSQLSKDTSAYPMFDQSFASAMESELRRFVRYVMREDDGTLDTLLTAPYSFPSGKLAAVYGTDAAIDDHTPVQLNPKQRAGLLTQPAFLAVHAHADQSSPVQRGKVVIRNLLCETLPDPPPNVIATAPVPADNTTTRQRFSGHAESPACAGCHVRIDGVGFGFEAFDALGAYRATENGKPVDTRGTFAGTLDLDGPFAGPVELARKLSESEEVSACVTKQWFRFALGRFETQADSCSLDALARAFDASGRDVRSLLTGIVSSLAFRMKRAPEAQP